MLSNTDPRSIGGCQAKILRAYVKGTDDDPAQNPESGDLINCAAPNPLYSVPTLNNTQAIDGQQYSNKPLSLITNFGTDQSIWWFFLYRWDKYGSALAGDAELTLNIMWKINITFTGLRWNPGVLFQPEPSDDSDTENPLVLHNPYASSGEKRHGQNNKSSSQSTVCNNIRSTQRLHNTEVAPLSHVNLSGPSEEHISLYGGITINHGRRRCLVPTTQTVPGVYDGGPKEIYAIYKDEGPTMDEDGREREVTPLCRESSPTVEEIELSSDPGLSKSWEEILRDCSPIPFNVPPNHEIDEIQTTSSTQDTVSIHMGDAMLRRFEDSCGSCYVDTIWPFKAIL